MKIPKYIEKALSRRENAAYSFLSSDVVVSEFIEKNNIAVEYEDYCCGCESIGNPRDSANRVRQAIENHEK